MRCLLSFACLVPFASAAIDQYCAAFEGPLGGFSPVFKVGSAYYETNVILLHVRDLGDKYRKFVDLDKWVSVDDVYPLHTGPNEAGDTMSLLDLEAVKEKDKTHEFPIINTTLQVGQSVSYTVPGAGVYCAIAHWDSAQQAEHKQPLVALTEHQYGNTPLTHATISSLVVCAIGIAVYNLVLIPKVFPDRHNGASRLEGWKMTTVYVLAGRLLIWWNQYLYTWAMVNMTPNDRDMRPSAFIVDKWLFLDHFLSLAFTYAFFKLVACGMITRADLVHLSEMDRIFLKSGCESRSYIFAAFTHWILPWLSSSGVLFTLFVDMSAALVAIALFSWTFIEWGSLMKVLLSVDRDITGFKIMMYGWFLSAATVMLSLSRDADPATRPGPPPCYGFVQDSRLSYNHIIVLGYITQTFRSLFRF